MLDIKPAFYDNNHMERIISSLFRKTLLLLFVLAFIMQGSVFYALATGETDSAVSGDTDNGITDDVGLITADDAASAAQAAESNENTAPPISFIPKDRYSTLKFIDFPFLDTKAVAYEWHFPYADKFFRRSSDSFSISLAQGSLGLALSAFRSTPDVVAPQYETYLREAGFTDLYSFGYDQPTTENSLSGIIGSKKIDDFTLIAAVTCGQGYENEWAGNLRVGSGDRHEGFNRAAQKLENYIRRYIRDNKIDGEKKLWLSGISRAAAVGNITAADMIESGEYEDIYAYLFGVPRTTKAPVRYSGIYNICGQYDPVSSVPLQSWGYERYGTDLYTPAQEAETSFTELASYANQVSQRLENKNYRNNPEINYQLHLIMEFLGEFFPTSEDYAERFQDELINAWNHHDHEHLATMIKSAMSDVDTSDPRERYSRRVFIDYISYIAAQHMRYEQRQVKVGSWDPDESLAANVALEHRPSTYVKWLFAHIDDQDMLLGSVTSRRIAFDGNVSVTVCQDGVPLTWIDDKGNVYIPEPASDYKGEALPELFMMKNGRETVVSLPSDEEYYIEIGSAKGGHLTYFDVNVSPKSLMGSSGQMWLCMLQPGRYGFTVTPGQELADPETIDGGLTTSGSIDFKYSPAIVMSNELDSTRMSYLSLSNALVFTTCVIGFLLLLGMICLVTSLIHWYKIKRLGHKPYSNWYVIVPHIIVIAVFAAMTQFFTFFLFSIGRARAECAAICVLFIFLLALRGSLRSRRRSTTVYTLAMFALVPLTQLYYHNGPLDTYSTVHMILYFLIVALLTYGAVRTFPQDAKDKTVPAA